MLGSNGAGKSTLIHHFGKQNIGHVRRITTHRQVWFNSDAVELLHLEYKQINIKLDDLHSINLAQSKSSIFSFCFLYVFYAV